MEEKEKEEIKVKAQFVDTVSSFIFYNAAKSIVGYIAVYLFRPFWKRFIKYINKEK
jgi:hypothetical protein